MRKNTPALLARIGLILAVSICVARADLVDYLNTFDNANSFIPPGAVQPNYEPHLNAIRLDNPNGFVSVGASNVVWSTNNDTSYTPNSGSVEFDFTGINSTTNDNGSKATWTMDIMPASVSSNVQITAVAFDIMVDPHSATDIDNGYGNFTVLTRDSAYNYPTNNGSFTNYSEELGNPTYSNNIAGTWEHIIITGTNGLPSAGHETAGYTNQVSGITWLWYFGGHQINGNVTCYLDNLVLYTNGNLTAPALGISKYSGLKGVLNCLTTANSTVDPANHERQGIRTVARTYSWIGSASTPFPSGGGTGPTNTYSVTIANYPAPAYSNFETYLWIVTGTPTEPNADWVETNNVLLDIENHADGTATGTLRWKVYDPLDDTGYYGSTGLYSTGLLAVAASASPLGTWTIQFDHDTNVSLTAPGGNPVTTNMPYISDDLLINGMNDYYTYFGIPVGAAMFKGPCTVFVGCQANLSNNIGQQAGISGIQITSNGVSLVNETFPNGLNTGTWTPAGEDPSGLSTIPGYASCLLNWKLPDTGFVLMTSTNLADPNAWVGTTILPFANNGSKSAYAPGGDKVFYQLRYILPH